MRIEDVIISGLMIDQEYARKSIPHLSGAYFQERADAVLFEEVSAFFLKYNELPTKEIIRVQLGQRIGVSDGDLET
jgi:hypothetical protein